MFTPDLLDFQKLCSYAHISSVQPTWIQPGWACITPNTLGILFHLMDRDLHSDSRLELTVHLSEMKVSAGAHGPGLYISIRGAWIEPDGEAGVWFDDTVSYIREAGKMTDSEIERIISGQIARHADFLKEMDKR